MNLNNVGLVIGLDWADRAHMCCLTTAQGEKLGLEAVGSAPEVFAGWLEAVERRYPQGRIVVVIERPDGPVVELMRCRQRWEVVAVNPVMLHRFRQAFSPSGAKGDPGDAALLGKLVVTHAESLTPLPPEPPKVRLLAALVEKRRHWVETRTGLLQQLIEALKKYYPQALELAGENLVGPMAMEFLRRWPDLSAVRRTRWSTLERFYRRHHSGRKAVLTRRQQLLAQASIISESEAYLCPLRLHLLAIIGQIEALGPTIAAFDTAIRVAYGDAPGRAVIDSLPGAGPALAPRLWVACQRAGAHPRAQDLALRSGIAPIQKQSGQSKMVLFRFARPRFLHQTWTEFAYHSLENSVWAKACHDHRKAKGHSEGAILRGLAFKWQRIVARIWQDQVPYDENRYLMTRTKRLAAA